MICRAIVDDYHFLVRPLDGQCAINRRSDTIAVVEVRDNDTNPHDCLESLGNIVKQCVHHRADKTVFVDDLAPAYPRRYGKDELFLERARPSRQGPIIICKHDVLEPLDCTSENKNVPRRAIIVGSFSWTAKQMSLRRFLETATASFTRHGIELDVVGLVKDFRS